MGCARCQHMGDTLMPTHRLHFHFSMGGLPMLVTNRPHRSSISLMKLTDQEFGIIDRPDSPPQTPQRNHLSDESFPYETFAPCPAYLPVAANPPHLRAK